MSKGKYGKKKWYQRRAVVNRSLALALVLACVLLVGGVVGGTVAWLTAQDDPVVNTFSPSTIGVELKEHTYNAAADALSESETTETGVTNYKMIPGWTIPKDPQAWITENSEAAYLFVEIEESANFDDFMTYAIADGWTLLDGTTAEEIDTAQEDTYVIYREVAAGNSAANMDDQYAFAILKNDAVTVKGEGVTMEMMNALTDENKPTLTFTAYAHQLYKSKGVKFEVSAAWNNAKPQVTTP